MSTHSRLACAVAALCLAAPTAAVAEKKADQGTEPYTGGAAYGASSAGPAAKFARVGTIRRVPLRLGMRGRDVTTLQSVIGTLGIRVRRDGSFGHATWAALRRIEKRAGLPVDGVLSRTDLATIAKIVQQGGFHIAPNTPAPLTPGSRAKLLPSGLAVAPANAPQAVKDIIAAGNEIATKPYVYGGGHGRWKDRGYDCSGSVSYALHGAGLLKVSRASTGFETYGVAGPGRWVTTYANAGHMYMVVAGLRFDTSGAKQSGSRWQTELRPTSGYVVRHPSGL